MKIRLPIIGDIFQKIYLARFARNLSTLVIGGIPIIKALLIVAEMPGICVEDVKIELRDDLLTICADRGEKKYRKEVLLPGVFSKEKMQVTGNNGVVEIKFPR